MRWFGGFAVVPLCIIQVAVAQRVPAPNGSFDDGTDAPSGWLPSGAARWEKTAGVDGTPAIAVTGDGRGASSWTSDSLPLRPGQLYALRFKARSLAGASGGNATSGLPFCNRDLGTVPTEWTQYQTIFLTPTNLTPEGARLHFGQRAVVGTVLFDEVEVYNAMAMFGRPINQLGDGEAIVRNAYSFSAILVPESGNFRRPVHALTATYDTNRWKFAAGQEIVFRHFVNGPPISNQGGIEFQVDVTRYTQGRLVIEWSSDGISWTVRGELDGAGSKRVTAGTASEVAWVRLRAVGTNPNNRADFDVGHYAYCANVSGATDRIETGKTYFARILRQDPRFDVQFHGFGDAWLGAGNNQINSALIRRMEGEWEIASVCNASGPGWSHQGNLRRERFDKSPFRNLAANFEVKSPGRCQVDLVIAEFVAKFDLEVPTFNANPYGKVLWCGSDRSKAIWSVPSGWKVHPFSTSRTPRDRGDAIEVSLAANETEAVQLVVTGGNRCKVRVATALWGPDRASIPAQAVEFLQVEYVRTLLPSSPSAATAFWPDPLRRVQGEMYQHSRFSNTVVWIRVRAPRDAKPGVYQGVIQVSSQITQDIPIRVTVYGFALPDRPTLMSAVGISPENIFRYHALKTEEDKRRTYDSYLANLAAHRVSAMQPAAFDPIRVIWPDPKAPIEQLKPRLDFEAWDDAVSRALEVHHFSSLMVPVPGFDDGSLQRQLEQAGFAPDTPAYRAVVHSYHQQVEQHLRDKGWLDRAFVARLGDDDSQSSAARHRDYSSLKAAAPHIGRVFAGTVDDELVGGPNVWALHASRYDPTRADQRRKQGDHFWWDLAGASDPGYATLFIDEPGTAMRAWLWQAWHMQVEGILIRRADDWTSEIAYPDVRQDSSSHPRFWGGAADLLRGSRRPRGNGEARLIYPPAEPMDKPPKPMDKPPKPILSGPVDSIRWEMLRDGIEDFEYLVILRRLLRDRGDQLTPETRTQYQRLLEVPPEITRDLKTYNSDPAPILARRDQIARAIERLLSVP